MSDINEDGVVKLRRPKLTLVKGQTPEQVSESAYRVLVYNTPMVQEIILVLLIQAGIEFNAEKHLVKTCNNRFNVGRTPESALIEVLKGHLNR